MGQNADTLKEGYEAYGRGDLEAAMENWHDDIRWEGSNYDRLPGSGVHEGKQAIAGALQETAQAYDEFTVHPDEHIEDGDTVVTLGHTQLSKGDKSEDVPFVHIWRFEGGKVKRVQLLTDTAIAADVAGV
jgi:uncharacterized protein